MDVIVTALMFQGLILENPALGCKFVVQQLA